MNKILIYLFLIIAIPLKAQTYPSDSLKKLPEYGMVVPVFKSSFSNKIFLNVDFGDGMKMLKDEHGDDRTFVSKVAALNYIAKQGWEIIAVTKHSIERYVDEQVCYLVKRIR